MKTTPPFPRVNLPLGTQIPLKTMEEIRVSTQNKTIEDITKVVLESFTSKARLV